eukprot:3202190-Rhodomonas_salina.1
MAAGLSLAERGGLSGGGESCVTVGGAHMRSERKRESEGEGARTAGGGGAGAGAGAAGAGQRKRRRAGKWVAMGGEGEREGEGELTCGGRLVVDTLEALEALERELLRATDPAQ